MLSILSHKYLAHGRLLPLLALLTVLGLQVLEAQHSHSYSDQSQQCLLCQGTADNTLTSAPSTAPVAPADPGFSRSRPAAAPFSLNFSIHARGPPGNS